MQECLSFAFQQGQGSGALLMRLRVHRYDGLPFACLLILGFLLILDLCLQLLGVERIRERLLLTLLQLL